MNEKQLEALIYLSRNQNFTKAAEMLYFDSEDEEYMTPETLQYRIKSLEEELGVLLYKRQKGVNHVTLTREGNLFLKEAQGVYQRMRQWRSIFTESEHSRFSFAATELVILHRLPDVIMQFHKRFPKSRIEMRSCSPEKIESLVRRGEVDFGLATHAPDDHELEYTVWKKSRLVLITPKGHPLASKKDVTLEDVADHPLIMLNHDPSRRDDRARIDLAFRRRKIPHAGNIVMVTSDSEIVMCYVEKGLGIGIVSETSLIDTSRQLEVVNVGNVFGTTEIGVLVREDKVITAAMREFFLLLSPKLKAWFDKRTPGRTKQRKAAPILEEAGSEDP